MMPNFMHRQRQRKPLLQPIITNFLYIIDTMKGRVFYARVPLKLGEVACRVDVARHDERDDRVVARALRRERDVVGRDVAHAREERGVARVVERFRLQRLV